MSPPIDPQHIAELRDPDRAGGFPRLEIRYFVPLEQHRATLAALAHVTRETTLHAALVSTYLAGSLALIDDTRSLRLSVLISGILYLTIGALICLNHRAGSRHRARLLEQAGMKQDGP